MKIEQNEDLARIISRYLAGSAESEEKALLEEWVKESDENKKCFIQAKRIWETSGSGQLLQNIDADQALKRVIRGISGRSDLKRIWTFWIKVAAFLFVPLLAANIIWFSLKTGTKPSSAPPVYSEVFATFGTRTALKLADSSLVWLNSGSSLRYPDKFTGKSREVYLDGEAYFEVSANPEMPFIVRTNDLNVKATGTKFDVFGYKSDSRSEITLVDGKISVSRLDNDGNHTLLSELHPDQHLVYNRKTSQVTVENEDSYKYYSWKDGKLIFRNEPMADVVSKLSQVFNVDIELQGKSLQDYRYRATFEEESLSEILRLLEISSPIRYREIKRLPLPDGSFPRKKVIIYPVKE